MSLPVPSNPHQFWSALELHDGSVPVWPSYQDNDNERHNTHVGFMHANNISPEQVKEYWVWEPREQRWDNLTKYDDMYKSLHGDPEASKWYFGAANDRTVSTPWGLPTPNPDYRLPGDSASLQDIQPWEPGHHGKFIGYPDGHVQVWRNQPNAYWPDSEDPEIARDGWPSHMEAANAIGRPVDFENDDSYTFGFISPEGEISTSMGQRTSEHPHIQSVMRQYPGTQMAAGWHFGGIGDAYNRLVRGPNWNTPASTPEQAAQGKMCYFHPNVPAVAATAFAPMCASCYAQYQRAQQRVGAAEDDPYYDPEFPTDEQLDAEDDKWWDTIKPGSHPINKLSDLEPWHPGVQGKGLITRDGKIITWDNIGIHHQEVAQLLPRGPKDVHTYLDAIEPDGTVGMTDYDPALERPLAAVGLKPVPLNEWSF